MPKQWFACWVRYTRHSPWQRIALTDDEGEGHVILAQHLKQRQVSVAGEAKVVRLDVSPAEELSIPEKVAGYLSTGTGA